MRSLLRAASMAAITMLAAGCASSHAAVINTGVGTTTTLPASPKQAAISLSRRMLDDASLPAGAHLSTAPPPAHLDGPQEQPAIGNLVIAHRLWSVPGAPDDVQRWLEAHVPAGYVKAGTGSVSGPGYRIVGVQDDLAGLPANISIAQTQFAIAPDGSDSIVRVDTLVGWTVPRPADEFVPAKDRVVTVRVVRAVGPDNPAITTRVVTDPRLVEPIVKTFNALAVSPPHAVHSCPMISSGTVSYRVAFSTTRTAPPDITATVGNCNGVFVSVGRRTAPSLGEFSSGAFADAVAHALGLPSPHFN